MPDTYGRLLILLPVAFMAIVLSSAAQAVPWNAGLPGAALMENTSVAHPNLVSAGQAVTTTLGSPAPAIDVWYGDHQVFGHIGVPQRWVNILGNVSDQDGLASLSYALNGGPTQTLSIGPNGRRLAFAGDFNAEIAYSDLLSGPNQVTLFAADNLSNTRVKTVTVEYITGKVWPKGYAIDWSSVVTIPGVAQIVDGLWALDGDTVRPVPANYYTYDRLIAIGDMTWLDYEVTVPIKIHRFYGNDPGVGILVRWSGHADDDVQPHWYPLFGGLGWFRFPWSTPARLSIMGSGSGDIAVDNSGRQLQLEVPYIFKMRVETLASGKSFYSFKVWEASAPEPVAWDLSGVGNHYDPDETHGSMMLVAHRTDASFGNVTIRPYPDAYTLTTHIVGQGTVSKSPELATYPYGQVVTLTASAMSGWNFANWTGDFVGYANPDTIKVDGDKVVTGTFVQDDYLLLVNVVGKGAVSKNPDQQTYRYGDVVTLTAVADPKFRFDGWNGDLSGTENPRVLGVQGNTVVTGTFVFELFLPVISRSH